MPDRDRRRTTALAWEVLRRPDRLPQVLRHLLGGAEVRWHPVSLSPGPSPGRRIPFDGTDRAALRLRDRAGGTLTAERHRAPFTFTLRERIAARLLTELAHRRVPARWSARRTVRLAGGAEVAIRPAGRRDLRAVTMLHALCAPLAGGALTGLPDRETLAYLLHPRVGHSVLVRAAGARPVAWASVAWDGFGADALLLAAEAWKDRGLLPYLLRDLIRRAEEAGCRTLWVYAMYGDAAAHRAATGLGLPHAVERADEWATIFRLRLDPSTPGTCTPVHPGTANAAGKRKKSSRGGDAVA